MSHATARAFAPSSSTTLAGDHHVVVDVIADRLGVLDVLLVRLDERRE